MITPKGLHILERFIAKNGISANQLLPVFASQPICMRLLHLERRSGDDEIMISKGVMEVLFRRFTGNQPNVTRLSDDDLASQYYQRWYNTKTGSAVGASSPDDLDRSLGMPVRKNHNPDLKRDEYQFGAISACEWLVDNTTCVGMDEASEICAHFVRYGLIVLVSDRGRVRDGNIISTVRAGGAGGGAGGIMVSREMTTRALLRRTGRSRFPRDRQGSVQDYSRRHGPRSLDRGYDRYRHFQRVQG